MQDNPPPALILEELRLALQKGIAPGFASKVAANAVALVARAQALSADFAKAEQARLQAILGRTGDLETLQAHFTQALRSGSVDKADPTVEAHLIHTTIEKIMVDQPDYPAWRLWQRQTAD